MKKNVIETLVGAVVLVIAVGFGLFAYKNAGISTTKDSYRVIAKFERADGVKTGTDVRIGGVKVGVVTNAALDSKTYLAQLDMAIDKNIQIPKDSSAQIVSDGLLGGKYIALVPGADEAMLQSGEEITFTQSSVNLETLIGKMIFNGSDKPAHDKGANDDQKPAAVPTPSLEQTPPTK